MDTERLIEDIMEDLWKNQYGVVQVKVGEMRKILRKYLPEDREKVEIYFETNIDFSGVNNVRYYNLYLGDGKYIFWNNVIGINAAVVGNRDYYHTYEVVPA